MPVRPILRMSDGHYVSCTGTVKAGHAPYLFVGDRNERHVASGPLSVRKKDMRALETFLRRSLEAVTGKKVVLR